MMSPVESNEDFTSRMKVTSARDDDVYDVIVASLMRTFTKRKTPFAKLLYRARWTATYMPHALCVAWRLAPKCCSVSSSTLWSAEDTFSWIVCHEGSTSLQRRRVIWKLSWNRTLSTPLLMKELWGSSWRTCGVLFQKSVPDHALCGANGRVARVKKT